MEELTFDEFEDLWSEVETAVDATSGIDPWCSGPDWTIPVATGFAPEAERLLLTTPARDGFALLAKYYTTSGAPMYGGLEPLWGFGCPIFGRTEERSMAKRAAAALGARDDWQLLYLPGLPTMEEDGPTFHRVTLAMASAFTSIGEVRIGEGITRQVADLQGGHDEWLARRTPRFRRNLRQATARAKTAGLTIVAAADDPDLFTRMMEIEYQSWKGQEGSGITTIEMQTTYRVMIERLRKRGRLLAHIAQLDGRDVGYILGGVRGRRYRGLQISYVDDTSRLSVGNVLQLHQLVELDRLDLADTYDLGMDFDYKRRWADRAEPSLAIIVDRR